MIITIDGVAASGKGVLAQLLAKHYACDCLPTGNLYRICAKGLIEEGIDIDQFILSPSEDKITAMLEGADISDNSLGGDVISKAASKIAKVSTIRQILTNFQREWIKKRKKAVVEGRDIGTVVWPQAEVKLFLVADPEVRAKRRADQLRMQGESVSEKEIYANLIARDKHDSERDVAPMKMADDAILLDTSYLTIEEVYMKAIDLIEKKHVH
jgi:cytidylate kinase